MVAFFVFAFYRRSPIRQTRPVHRHQPPTAHPTRPPPGKLHPHIPNTRTRPQDLVVAFWCLGIIFYHPDMKNATTGSRSSCQGCCQHPRHENATSVSRFSCLGCPSNPLPPRHEERDPLVAFFVSGVSLHPSLHPQPAERLTSTQHASKTARTNGDP